MIRLNSIILFLLLPFTISTLHAQNLSFGRLPDELSISNITVRTMLQDSKGFLWFGTWNGLFRYDGYNLRKFKVSANLASENKGSKIVALHEDINGFIWIATQNTGVYRFDPKTELFAVFQHDDNNSTTLASDQVSSILEDKKGRIWIGTKYGVDLYENGIFKHFESSPLSKVAVQNITQARDGSLWCATFSGVYSFFDAPDGSLITHYYDLQVKNQPVSIYSYDNNSCYTILEDPSVDNLFWIGTKHGLKKLDASKNQLSSIEAPTSGISNNIIYTFLFSSNKNNHYMWIGTDAGLNRFNLSTGKFEAYFVDSKNPNSLRNNSIQSLLEDKSGLLWIGTNKGINKLNLREKAFEKIYVSSENNVSSLTKTNKSLWVGTYGQGIYEISYTNGEKSKPKLLPLGSVADYIYGLHADTEGYLWAATRGNGILKIPLSAPNNYSQYSETNNRGDNYIMSLFEDSHHTMWFGTWDHGLLRYDRTNDRFTIIKDLPNSSFKLTNYPIVQIYELKSENNERLLWLGTRGGGLIEVVLDDNSNIIRVNNIYQNNPKNQHTLSSNFINCFLKDASGRIWIGTEEGLNLWNNNKKVFYNYSKKDGIPEENIQSIAEDDKRNLWVTTNYGLSRINFDKNNSLISRNFDAKDGLPSNYFHPSATCTLNEKQLYFGSTGGILAFYPDEIKDNETPPTVSLVDFKLFNQSINVGDNQSGRTLLPLSISDIKKIELAYSDNAFSIEFAALHFDEPDKNRYAYRLVGFNDNWIYANANERTAHYTNLPHGTYTFEVKASNNDGVWSKEIAKVIIVVKPPFWLTWWAYLFYIACIGGAIWFYRKTLLVRENLKNQVQMETFKREQSEEVSQMKVRFFTNVSHELRTPLTLILSPLEELMKREDNITPSVRETYELMQRNAMRLFNLITQLLDFRKTEEGLMKLEVVETDLIKYLTNVIIAFRDLARQRNIDFRFITAVDVLKIWIDRDLMEKVFFNILSNAFKYTDDGGKITVKLHLDEQRNAVISVEDTGMGIAADELPHIFEEFYRGKMPVEGKRRQGTGVGLALTKSILELHNSQIYVVSEIGKGSDFTITIPLGTDHIESRFINHQYKSSEDITQYPSLEEVKDTNAETLPPQYDDIKMHEKSTLPLVLIIEDNPDIRTFIKMSLSHFYTIEEAENGLIGIEKAQKLVPDLIISDVIMPEMDGLEVCKTLKNTEATCHIPIILLTARSSQLYKIEGYEIGADDYVTKPFNMTLLLTRVKNLLENRERVQRRFDKNFSQTPAFEVKPSELNITHLDKKFLDKCIELVERHMEDTEYSVEQMSRSLLMSRMQVYRKIKALTGDTPNHFIRTIRLKRAAQLLEKGYSVAETTYKVGFQDLKYFRECFKKQFGVNPSEYVSKPKEV